MENYIGKTCPFCKNKITDADQVMVCPSCGAVHHLNCWNENKGCTTFGCSKQHYEEQHTNHTDVCTKCGATLADKQTFCPKCGAAKVEPVVKFCPKCNTELADDQIFCPKCGHKIGVTVDAGITSAISQFKVGIDKVNEVRKKLSKKVLIGVIAAIVVIIGGVNIVPKLLIDTAGYIEQGKYEKAYSKAKTKEEQQMVTDAYMSIGDYTRAHQTAPDDKSQQMVKIENLAAYYSAYSANNLKDPSSFELRDAYYNMTTNDDGNSVGRLVLYLSGANSYGAKVSNYWLYTSSDDEWEYFCSVSDLEDEEYSKYDDEDEAFEKLVNNVGRSIISTTLKEGTKLNKDGVKRINQLFEDDKLDDVSLIKE